MLLNSTTELSATFTVETILVVLVSSNTFNRTTVPSILLTSRIPTENPSPRGTPTFSSSEMESKHRSPFLGNRVSPFLFLKSVMSVSAAKLKKKKVKVKKKMVMKKTRMRAEINLGKGLD